MSGPRLNLVHLAIRSGVMGHIQWKESADRLLRMDPPLPNLLPEAIRARLRQFVMDGNSLDVRKETREEYLRDNPADPYWYRAIIPMPGLVHGLIVEIKLVDDDPDEPWVEIVSAHRQES